MTDEKKAQLVALAAMETVQRITHVLLESSSEDNQALGAAIDMAMLPFARQLAIALGRGDLNLC
jgi:hypothetical protein